MTDSEDRLELLQGRAVVATAVDAIISIDQYGCIALFNPAAEAMFGYQRQEVIGKNVSLLMPIEHAQHHDDYIQRYLTTGEAKIIGLGRRIQGKHKSGRIFAMELAVSEFRLEGRPMFTGIIRDISKQVESEQKLTESNDALIAAMHRLKDEQAKLLQAEKLSSLGTLVAGVAHEINNPLAGIKACISVLQKGVESEVKEQQYLATIADAVQRAEQTVRALLDFARPRPPMRQHCSVQDLIDACLLLVNPQLRHQNVNIHSTQIDAWIDADRSQIIQALLNVILNALYVSHTGDTIHIGTESSETQIAITITDQGPGMPDEVQRRALEPFFSTKPEGDGTGLGLSVTNGIMQTHDGRLEICNVDPKGTMVRLWFPKVNP